jgi:hypothetical protein
LRILQRAILVRGELAKRSITCPIVCLDVYNRRKRLITLSCTVITLT